MQGKGRLNLLPVISLQCSYSFCLALVVWWKWLKGKTFNIGTKGNKSLQAFPNLADSVLFKTLYSLHCFREPDQQTVGSQTLTSVCSMRGWKPRCVGQDFQPRISPSCNSKNQTQKCAKRWKPLHCWCSYSPFFFLWSHIKWPLKADIGLFVVLGARQERVIDLVIDVNTVEQILWDQPHSPGCLFQLSSCSPMQIFLVTRDTGQESYSIFFLMSWVFLHVSMH